MLEPGHTQNLSREEIKLRMLRDAAQQWNLTAAQMADLDPLVDKLFGACATEIKKIQDEVADSHTRVLNRLAQLLTPEVLSTPYPAHAIAHAHPTELETEVNSSLQLIGRNNRKPDERIYFSPTGNYLLKDAQIAYLAHGKQFLARKQKTENNLLLKARGNGLPGATLWLGLEVNPKLADLRNLNFYFHWRELGLAEENDLFYYRLSMSRWSIRDRQLGMHLGYHENEQSPDLLSPFDEMTRIEQETASFYRKGFATIQNWEDDEQESIKVAELTQIIPPIVESVFPKSIELITKPHLWIKIQLPESWADRLLDKVEVATNCFPVLNRRLHKYTHWLGQRINILPLETEHHFLAVHNVHDAEKRPLRHIPFNPADPQMLPRTYSLRWGGTGRYDARNAADLLAYLFELLRDESAAFKALGYEVLSSDIVELNQILTRIEKNISDKNLQAESVPYLVIRTESPNENVYIWFWSTNAEIANGISGGSDLEIYGNAMISNANLYLLTKPRNGQSRKGEVNRLMEYRQALLSRDRIVTEADIRLACKSWLGDLIDAVEVGPLLAPSTHWKKGLVRKIGVWLSPADTHDAQQHDWVSTCQDIESLLSRRSNSILGYKVQLKSSNEHASI